MTKTLINTLYSISLALLLSLTLVGAVHAGSDEFQNDATDKINDVEKQLSELRGLLSDAREANIFTSYAEDELEDAEDLYDEAIEEKIDEDWDESLEFAEEAYDILEDAIKNLFEALSGEAKDEIKEARKLLEIAEELLLSTDEDDKDYDDAVTYFDRGEVSFDEAEEGFDDEDYDRAEFYAKDANKQFVEVFDELDVNIEDYLEEREKEEAEQEEKEEAEKATKEKIEYEEKVDAKMNATQKAQLAQIDLLIEMLMQIRDLLFVQADQN